MDLLLFQLCFGFLPSMTSLQAPSHCDSQLHSSQCTSKFQVPVLEPFKILITVLMQKRFVWLGLVGWFGVFCFDEANLSTEALLPLAHSHIFFSKLLLSDLRVCTEEYLIFFMLSFHGDGKGHLDFSLGMCVFQAALLLVCPTSLLLLLPLHHQLPSLSGPPHGSL